MVLGDAVTKLQTSVWILNRVSRMITLFNLKHQFWSNNQSQHDLSYGGVSLSISLKFETRSSSLRNSAMTNMAEASLLSFPFPSCPACFLFLSPQPPYDTKSPLQKRDGESCHLSYNKFASGW